ncbi:MAG: type IV secretory system conjugative DNA transfer family protein [Bacteroidia bacterium]
MTSGTLSGKSVKEYLIVVLVILLFLIIADYLFTAQIYGNIHFRNFFYKGGEIFRAAYFFMFGITCFYHAKSNMDDEGKNALENNKKITYFIISFICVALLIFITSFNKLIVTFLYPIAFFIANFTIAKLILSYVEPDKTEQGAEGLGVEKRASIKPLAIVFKVRGGFVNMANAFRSALIIGGAGAGKSASIIEPMMYDATKKGFAILVYDYKFPTLGNFLHSCFVHHKIQNKKFYSISFTDITRSHRFNPIDPRLMPTSTYAEEYSWTLYSNLDKAGAKTGGFFPESASSLLKAVIWFMKLKHPDKCTMPHVINLILNAKTEVLIAMLLSEDETKGMCKPVAEAAGKKEAGAQLAGVVGSLTMQLGKINTPETNWVLSGNEFTLDINNPNNPKCLVLGNSPQVDQALSPILAFICNIALKLMNDQKKIPSLVILDEAPSLTIPNIEKIPATARSNKLGLVYCAQDFSQMDKYLGKESRQAIVSNLATQFYGQISSFETAEYASKLVGKSYRKIKSSNKGLSTSDGGESSSQGFSYSEQQREIVTPQEFITMPTGTFIGKLVESTKDWFEASFYRVIDDHPEFTEVEIPHFVKTFWLTEEDNTAIENEFQIALTNPERIFMSGDKDTQDLIYKYNYDGKLEIEISEQFLDEYKIILIENYKKEKNLKILNDNFSKIQSEVEDLILLYTDN